VGGEGDMSTLGAFIGSPLRGFVESPLGARGGQPGTLYAFGDFNQSNGDPVATCARWDDPNWIEASTNLSGFSGSSDAIEYDGSLYCTAINGNNPQLVQVFNGVDSWAGTGSLFNTSIDRQNFGVWDNLLVVTDTELEYGSNVAQYDGSNWSAVGTLTTNSSPNALVSHDGDLFVGHFGALVERYDGASWVQVSPLQVSGDLRTLVSFDGSLYAGGKGQTTLDSGTNENGVWRWLGGTSWSPVGTLNSGTVIRVWQLGHHDGKLYAVDGAGEVSEWNGSSWSSIGSANNDVYTVVSFNGRLIVGGSFTSIDGVTANRVAQWDGTQWTPLGDGFDDDSVRKLVVFSG